MTARSIAPIKVNGEVLYVEVEEVAVAGREGTYTEEWGEESPPKDGAKPEIGEEALSRLKNTVAALCASLSGTLEQYGPSELALEAKISFGGKASPIPFLVSTASEAALTVKVSWKK